MTSSDYYHIERRPTRQVHVGSVIIGSDSYISVQSMTNTRSDDVEGTITQVRQLQDAGADIVRISCPDKNSVTTFRAVVENVDIPLVADIHFNPDCAILAAEAGAACIRWNPGNVNKNKVQDIIKACQMHGSSVRIGVNSGSLEPDLLAQGFSASALVKSALRSARFIESLGYDDIKISVKASDVHTMIAAYKELAAVSDYPLHLGVTEAGTYTPGTVKSAIGIGTLLHQGIGDTIRVSLSEDPIEEVRVGFEILKALRLRDYGVSIISCPSCARQGFDVISVTKQIEQGLSHIKCPIKISIIGCVVNGPGEAMRADIGVTGGGRGRHIVYIDGKMKEIIPTDALVKTLINYALIIAETKAEEEEAAAKNI